MTGNQSYLDPAKAGELLQRDYREYLMTNHRPDDKLLRGHFNEALENFSLSKGPFLHASPSFKHGASIQSLVDEKILDENFLRLPSDVFPSARPLYAHQEKAIRKILSGRNLIIATGTGSGKTECFIFPIIQELFKEIQEGTINSAGVRSLLLYPMNALANDQMKRLRELLREFPEITFGRFIGDTKEKYSDAYESFLSQNGEEPLPNELISRDQIRENPPHILLTNYSMLEYLLLRPADTALFDGESGRHWSSIVLDEVHVYSGAKGAEISMLLRRVKQRIQGSGSKEVKFIGTSATLGDGLGNAPEVVKFASDLFGEKVEYEESRISAQDLVLPEIDSLEKDEPSWSLSDQALVSLFEAVQDNENIDSVKAVLQSSKVPSCPETELWPYLWEVLGKENHVIAIRKKLISDGVIEFENLAENLFTGAQADRNEKLSLLLELCTRSSLTGSSASLIPARYHYFLRALEGAFICISPEHPLGVSNFSLTRQRSCQACEDANVISQMFELALCSNCGTSYLVGKLTEDDTFTQARISDQKLDYLWIDKDSPLSPDDHNEDEMILDGDEDLDSDTHYLCANCGTLCPSLSSDCGCGMGQKVLVQRPIIKNTRGTLSKCLKCSTTSSASLVKRFLSNAERPQSLIASSIYQSLPPGDSPNSHDGIGEGRKLLTFADSRQDAAFFAPYLSRLYQKSIYRKAIWELLNSHFAEATPRFGDLIQPLLDYGKKNYVINNWRK